MSENKQENKVELVKALPSELREFTVELQAAFAVATEEAFGPVANGPIPPDEDVRESLTAEGADVWHVMVGGVKVGGAVVNTDAVTGRSSLDLFFISPAKHNAGLGYAAWQAIERQYPDTRVWETVTPYFERRNINFYVNKCGFKIVEFYNEYHKDTAHASPVGSDGNPLPGTDAFFRFEKVVGKK